MASGKTLQFIKGK